MAESGSGLHWTVGCSVGNKQTDDEAGPAKQAQRNKPGKAVSAKRGQQKAAKSWSKVFTKNEKSC